MLICRTYLHTYKDAEQRRGRSSGAGGAALCRRGNLTPVCRRQMAIECEALPERPWLKNSANPPNRLRSSTQDNKHTEQSKRFPSALAREKASHPPHPLFIPTKFQFDNPSPNQHVGLPVSVLRYSLPKSLSQSVFQLNKWRTKRP